MRKLLVTGANGFIGRAIIKAAASYGWEAHALGWFNTPEPDDMPASSITNLDVRDELGLVDLFRYIKPDAVSHHAGMSGLEQCEESPTAAISVNVFGVAAVYELAREYGAHFLLASTIAMGINDDCPRSVLATSKLMAEQLLKRPGQGCRRSILRYADIYGPGDRCGLIADLVRQLLRYEAPTIRGRNLRREYVYIDDAVRAHFLALERSEGVLHQYSVTNSPSRQALLGEVYELLCRSVDRFPGLEGAVRPNPTWVEPASYDVDHLIQGAWQLEQLGWEPKVGLIEGIDRTVEWVAQLNGEFACPAT